MSKILDIVKELEKRVKEATTSSGVGVGGKVVTPYSDRYKKKDKNKLVRKKIGYID